MVKYSLILINLVGLFFFNLFSDEEILVNNQTPTVLRPGEKKEVQITINKTEIQGFAKMELELPNGFIATPGETVGASFTFNAQKARFVWMTLPADQSFVVTYYIECLPGMQGTYKVDGNFSYIKENKRVDYAIPTKSVTVNTEAPKEAVASTPTTTTPSETVSDPTPDNTAVDNTVADNTAVSAPVATETKSVSQPTSKVSANGLELSCTRTITTIGDNQYRVDLEIINNNITGFAKVLETVPANCTTEKTQDAGAVVTVERNIIKFVWFEIPTSPTVHVSYKISCAEGSSAPVITGKLSYVDGNSPKELAVLQLGEVATASEELATSTIEVTKEATPVEEVKTTEPEKVVETVQEPVKETIQETTISNDHSASNETQTVEPKKRERAVTSTPSAENGVSYKVQILAAHRVVSKSYFQQKHGYSEDFNIENHEGWVKYTTGKYGEYKQARDRREDLKSSYSTLPGPFVTAYNNGERITVQEALLISKQQWYQ
jgi:hypothetical protein